MTNRRLAFTTFAIMKAPYGSPEVKGFEDRTPDVFREAENAQGFIARAVEIDARHDLTNFERDWGPWGVFAVPSFYDGGRTTLTDTRASTLSIWRDVTSVRNFATSGLHLQALQNRARWFRRPTWPSYAMWWVDAQHVPTWSEASARLEHLHSHGPTVVAFNFSNSFDAEGRLEPGSRTDQSPSELGYDRL